MPCSLLIRPPNRARGRRRLQASQADSPNASRLVGGHCSVDAGDAPAISRGSAIWPLGHVQRNRKDAIGALAMVILAQGGFQCSDKCAMQWAASNRRICAPTLAVHSPTLRVLAHLIDKAPSASLRIYWSHVTIGFPSPTNDTRRSSRASRALNHSLCKCGGILLGCSPSRACRSMSSKELLIRLLFSAVTVSSAVLRPKRAILSMAIWPDKDR